MRLLLPLLVLLALLVAAFAADRPEADAELTTGYISIETLDPTRIQASEDVRVAYALFEGLTTFDPYTFTIEPGVAENWSVSDDRLTYRFELRDDARWSNGDPVTAGDYTATWRQSMLPDFASPYQAFLLYIDGAQDYFDWGRASLAAVQAIEDPRQRREAAARRVAEMPGKFEELVGVTAPDERTLIVRLERPVPYFLETVATWPTFALHRSVVDAAEIDRTTAMLRRDPQWTKAGRLIGNGPYRLHKWRFKREIRLEANEHYWNRPPDMPDSVRLVHFNDHLAAFNAYQTGAIDVFFGLVVDFVPDLLAEAEAGRRDDVHAFNNWGTYFYAFNCRKTLSNGQYNPFSDVRVRQAFARVIDKRAIVENVTRMHQDVARTFIPPDSIAGYEPPAGFDCVSDADSPAERQAMIADARDRLAEAGFEGPADFPTVTLMFNTGGGHERTAQAIQAMWAETLGVEVEFRTLEWKVFLQQYSDGRYMVARASWFGDYGDPTTFLNLFRTGDGNNDTGFSDPHYDQLLADAAAEPDPDKRFDLLERAEAYIMDRMLPMVPLYHYRLVHVYDPQRVRGVSPHPRNLQMFHRMRVVE